MRRGPIHIYPLKVVGEIMKAQEAHLILGPDHPTDPGILRAALEEVVKSDRLSMTDYTFRIKYVNYIKRGIP